jgi:hypothetical protein
LVASAPSLVTSRFLWAFLLGAEMKKYKIKFIIRQLEKIKHSITGMEYSTERSALVDCFDVVIDYLGGKK